MEKLTLVVTGCILFESQSESKEIIIVEVNDFHFMPYKDIDEFGDNYINNGGDSYTNVHSNMICTDSRALARLTDLEQEVTEELREFKRNGIIISSELDRLTNKLDLLDEWRYLFEV